MIRKRQSMFMCKRETTYEVRSSDWRSDVCASDLNQCLVTGSQTGCADHVDVLFQRERERLLRRLEQGSAYHFKTHVGKRRSNNIGATVMSVLAHLRDQHAGLTSLASLESIDAVDHPRPAVIVRICAAVDTLYRLGNSVIATRSEESRVGQGCVSTVKFRGFA